MAESHRAYQGAMRFRTLLFALLSLFASTAFAQNALRFDPPDPTSRTPVLAKVHLPSATCAVDTATVTRNGQFLGIAVEGGAACKPVSGVDLSVDLGTLPAGVYHISVSPGSTLLALAEATLVVRDAAPPFVVEPNTFRYPKGTARLSGHDLIACGLFPGSVDCEAVEVRIGDTPVEVVGASPDQIVVQLPGTLAEGVYDVTISRVTGVQRATAALQIGVPGASAFYERVLFPVFSAGPGAFGAEWKTDAWLYNGNTFPWLMPDLFFNSFCFPECDSSPLPGATAFGGGENRPAGVAEGFPRQALPRLGFGLHVRDLSRGSQDRGTEIPVVRERDLYDLPFQLLDVPADPRYRLTLRLYDLDGPRTFLVRVFAMNPYAATASVTPLTERSVTLTSARSLGNGGFAMISDPLAGLPASENAAYRVEIVPLDENGKQRFGNGVPSAWGFLTATNDETQHVTVISPQ